MEKPRVKPAEPEFPDLMKDIEQGDPIAVQQWLDRLTKTQGIHSVTSLKNGCLRILLTCETTPDRESTLNLLRQEVGNLPTSTIQTVKVYGQQTGEQFPSWSGELHLVKPVSKASQKNSKRKYSDFHSAILEELKAFQFSSVLPYRDALGSELYKSDTVKLLLFFSLFPWLMMIFAGSAELSNTAWMLGIYSAFIWGVVLRNLIRPPQFFWVETLKCILFTTFVGIPLLLIFQQVPPFNVLYAAARSVGLFPKAIGFVLGVGLLEEACKALPVYIFLLYPKKLKDPLTAAFYGSMSGLGFAIAEGVHYSAMYALGLSSGNLNLNAYVLANTIRFISLPLFHAIWAGIVGYFIGLAAIHPTRQRTIIFIGVTIAAVLHGLYNTFSNSLFGLFVLTFSILLFVAYLRRSKSLADEMKLAEREANRTVKS